MKYDDKWFFFDNSSCMYVFATTFLGLPDVVVSDWAKGETDVDDWAKGETLMLSDWAKGETDVSDWADDVVSFNSMFIYTKIKCIYGTTWWSPPEEFIGVHAGKG